MLLMLLTAAQAIDRRERLRRLALETIDLSKDPYFMRNHLGQVSIRHTSCTEWFARAVSTLWAVVCMANRAYKCCALSDNTSC